jgi:hypothetical protein
MAFFSTRTSSWLAALAAAVVLLAQPDVAVAADPVVTSARVQGPATITVGDRFNLVISVEADSGSRVSLAPGALPESLTVIGPPVVVSRDKGNGRSEITLTAQAAAFFVGDTQLPPLKLNVGDSAGAIRQVTTPPLSLSVTSTFPPVNNPEPRPLKPQAEIARVGTSAWVYISGALAISAIVLFAALWVRRRQVAPVPVLDLDLILLSPEDQARLELDRDAASDLAARDYPAFYSVLSTTVRRYLTERFGFPAFAFTTVELQRQMVARGIDRWQARLVGGLLEQCDAVVFAGYRPAPGRADSDLTAAYEIVEISRPPVAEEALV